MYPVFGMQKYPSGRRGSPAKGGGRETVARVQIPPSAPNPEVFTGKDFGIFYSRKSLALILGGAVPAGENSILYRVGHLAEESDGSAKINM